MKTMRFFKTALIMNIIGVIAPIILYMLMHPFDDDIASNIGFSIFAAVASFFLARQLIINNLVMPERIDQIMDGTDGEKKMVTIVQFLPIALGAIAFLAIGFLDDGLSKVGWIIIALSANIGQTLEALHRHTHSQ